jgi:hypothetical protein
MNTPEVEALVRSVITEFGMPFTLQSVVGSPLGWNIKVRAGGSPRIVSFVVPGQRALAIRAAVQAKLEDEF